METVRTKKVKIGDKVTTIELTNEELRTIQREADICKLNGWNFKKMLERLPMWTARHWPDVAAEWWMKSDPQVVVGMGATEILYSDSRAKTIVEVKSPREIVVAENETKCIDYYAGTYEILPAIADYMSKETFTLRKNGTWVAKGQPKKAGSVILIVGFRYHYIDPSF